MAINMLRRTIMLIMEYDPNISKPQNRVKPLIPCNSNDCKSTKPKLAQKRDCDVSNKLRLTRTSVWQTEAFLLGQIGVVPHQLVQTFIGDENQHVDEEELDDVDNDTAERNL